MKCSKNLFNSKDNPIVIPGNWNYKGVSNIMSQIINEFTDTKQDYALVYDDSVDEDTYIDSIDDFINSLIAQLPTNLDDYDKNRLINLLKLYYYPSTSKLDSQKDSTPISAIIPEAELQSQHEKNEQNLDNDLSDFFGENVLLKNQCKEDFKKQAFNNFIINIKNKTKISKVSDLNSSIEQYKNQLYNNIYNYLIERGITPEISDETGKPSANMFNSEHKVNGGYLKVLDDFYLLLTQFDLTDQLEQEYLAKYTNKRDSSLIKAINSYIQLLHFDELLESSFGKYISSNQDNDQIIIRNPDGTYEYKYQYGASNNMSKGWGIEVKDGIKELGSFSKLIIENIPLKGSNNQYLSSIDYFTALLKLKDHLYHAQTTDELRNLMLNFHNAPEESLKRIFELIMTKSGTVREDIKKAFKDDQIDYKINEHEYRILESINDFLYVGQDSIYNIENNSYKLQGIDSQYSILKTALGAFDSLSQMDYLEVVYDFDTSEYKVQVKKKYANKRELFDYKDIVNRKSREAGRRATINKYNSYYDSENNFNIWIGNLVLKLNSGNDNLGILGSSAFTMNLLDGQRLLVNNNQSLSTYFDIDLDNTSKRTKLINRENLTKSQNQFMEVVSFIDNMLHTNFGSSQEGLQLLNIYFNTFTGQEAVEQGLKYLLRAACKAHEATKININSKGDIIKEYLKEFYPQKVISSNRVDRKIYNSIFYSNYRGNFVYAIGKSQKESVWADHLIQARRIVKGDDIKSVTKNLFGENIPNTSPAFVGREIQQVLNDQVSEGNTTPVSTLLFFEKPKAIIGVVVDTDVKLENGTNKQVSTFSSSELLYHNFFNKFLLPSLNGHVIIQPTVYSDKKKFINYDINIKSVLGVDSIYDISSEDFERKFVSTIGQAYYQLYNQVLDDYEKLFGTRNVAEINQRLKGLDAISLARIAQEAGVSIMEELHYRKIGKGLALNELLLQYKTLYTDPVELHNRLRQEKIKYIQSLSKNFVSFKESDTLNSALSKLNAKSWIKDGLMALAKDSSGNLIFYGDIPADAQINPLLETYFYTDTLLSNNLRLQLVGSELNHKVKDLESVNSEILSTFTNDEIQLIKNSLGYDTSNINLADIKIACDNALEYDEDGPYYSIQGFAEIDSKLSKLLYKIESLAQNAQLKRTVPLPGTMRYFFQNSLDGIASTMKCAVIEDIKAPVYQFSGKNDKPIDSHDGAALVDPFTSILENLSLQDSEVGTIKKTLWHDFATKYMSADLVKYAEHTITNQWMRQSENSDVKLYDVFWKMTKEYWGDEVTNIMRMAAHKNSGKVDFNSDILQGNSLYYKVGNQSYKIEDFGKDDVGYYTIESAVTSDGEPDLDQESNLGVKKYHFFNGRSHYKVLEGEQIPENCHTISSLYELHSALGGIYSQSLMNDEQLHYSEASNYAVANFMNNVSIKVGNGDLRSQTNYRQPLKTALINYIINKSAIKNGASNVNPRSSYYDNTDLTYFTMSTKRYGIQQDSDHTADEAKMTEFSQVISSLDANGFYHDYVRDIYEVLGKASIEASQFELEGVKSFNEDRANNYKKLYEVVGRTLINNISLGGGKAGLVTQIIYALKKEFNDSVNHDLDKIKIPFSDDNIYNQIISTVASVINKKSIKREYPGNGMVMTPGYQICQIWDIDGKVLQFEDILNMVQVTQLPGESVSEANRRSVKAYLEEKQKDIPYDNNAASYYPSDNVNLIYFIGDQQGQITFSLDTMEKYQNFVNNTRQFLTDILTKNGITQISELYLQKNITKGRDLAPAKITYNYTVNGRTIKSNVFAHYTYKNAFGTPTKEQRKAIQKHLNNIDNGFIYLSEEDELSDIKTPIYNIENKPAEMIGSNIYQSRFGLNYYDSINDIVEESFAKPINLAVTANYDLALVKNNGNHLYISVNNTTEKRLKGWKNTIKKESIEQGEFVHKVFVTKDNIKLFEIGREIIVNDISYKDGKFYDSKGDQVKGNYSWDGKNVWEYVEFIENAQSPLQNGKNFKFYNINQNKLRKVFKGDNNSFREFTAKLIKDIYNSDSYELIHPNYNYKANRLASVASIFKSLSNQTKENNKLQQFLLDTSNLLLGIASTNRDNKEKNKQQDKYINIRRLKIGNVQYKDYVQNFRDGLKHKKYISFLKSKDFTSSRIPAQTLQSFMYMNLVGFTGVDTTQAYVSHFQTYLQGSDYDIDHSYMLGHEFDENGNYIGWSCLFNYDTIEELHASENLPYPDPNRIYEKSSDGINITEYVNNIKNSTGVTKINHLVRLINFLKKQNTLKITYEGDGRVILNGIEDTIENHINNHQNTHIPDIYKVAVMKNFVSSHIQKQIQGIKNMMAAYSPIEMDELQVAASSTPKAKASSNLTVLNPAMIPVMQNQNMVGKNVVGIAANGQKGNLMWNYYLNDVIRYGSERDIERAQFSFVSNRINNRFVIDSEQNKNLPEDKRYNFELLEINGLPDTNWEFEGAERLKQKFINPLNPNQTTDLIGSQYISAATDNAKELILDKINSGQATAKCHLFLLALGFDVKDIVSFMTSDAVSFIESCSQQNVFTGYYSSLDTISKGLIEQIKKTLAGNPSNLDTNITRFLKGKSTDELNELLADTIEFRNVLEGANEFSSLGRGFGINQGAPTTKESLVSWKQFFRNVISEREEALGITNNGRLQEDHDLATERVEFDFDRYLSDEQYRENLIDYYNKIKKTINVFAQFNYIPHFKSMFEMLGLVSTMDGEISLKSRLSDYYLDQAYDISKYVPDNTVNKINQAINIILIKDYISNRSFSIPTKEDWEMFGTRGERTKASGNIRLKDLMGVQNFKYIFEQYIIPELQAGTYFTEPSNNMSVSDLNNLVRTNDFIRGLVPANDGNIPIYKLDIDMLNIENNPFSVSKFQKFLNGFKELKQIQINGTSLTDWFMLYNLIVNKNRYGSDRMTTLFQELVKNNSDDYLINDYLQHVADLDYNVRQDSSILEDIKASNTLESLLMYSAQEVTSLSGKKDLYVKMRKNDGIISYYKNNGKIGSYSELPYTGLIEINGESEFERKQRIADLEEYGFGLTVSEYADSILKELDNNWQQALGTLLEQGYIYLTHNC